MEGKYRFGDLDESIILMWILRDVRDICNGDIN
jgi:hypothetical protein